MAPSAFFVAAAALLPVVAARLQRNGGTGTLRANALPQSFCDSTAQGESGYYSIVDAFGSKNYFYQFWESRNNPATDPVFLWLTGGRK